MTRSAFGAFIAGFAVLLFSAAAVAETRLERGTYLMRTLAACPICHTPWGPETQDPAMELAGGLKFETEAFTAYASNITPDPATGIGAWSDEQIITAIRQGKRPDGSIIGPPMPIHLYREISDRDVQAIVAYLRSVPAIQNEVPKSEYRIPLPPDYGPPPGHVPDIEYNDLAAYGRYLAGPIANCIECHTPLVQGQRAYDDQLGAGGFVLKGPWGEVVSRNITPNWKTGIGKWNSRKMRTAITKGVRPDGSQLGPPMPYQSYDGMDRQDLSALLVYVRSVPQLENDTD